MVGPVHLCQEVMDEEGMYNAFGLRLMLCISFSFLILMVLVTGLTPTP